MKPWLILILFPSICGVLPGQQPQRPAAIETEIKKSGRYALMDSNHDGWDDFWLHLFSKIDTSRPGLDEDHDGKTNYEEMLDYGDPYRVAVKARDLTQAEIKQAETAATASRRVTDKAKRQRFQNLVEARRVQKYPKIDSKSSPPLEERDSESSNHREMAFEPLMLCSTGNSGPKILAMERLSTGQCMIAWEGEPDRLFDVEFSDDLVNWRAGGINIPTLGGIGTWGCMTSALKRFFRVIQQDEVVIPSDPFGGDGVTTFGGYLSIENSINGGPSRFVLDPRLDGDAQPYSISVYIDGELWDEKFYPSGTVYRCGIPVANLAVGTHASYAVMNMQVGTTTTAGEADPVSLGKFRTPDQTFTLESPGTYFGSYPFGIRTSETEIDSEDPEIPDSTVFSADFQSETSYSLVLRNGDHEIFRQWNGLADSFAIPWDGTNEQGNPVPGDRYYLDLHLNNGGPDLDIEEVLTIAAGHRQWKMLCLMEPQEKVGTAVWDFDLFRPEWVGQLTSSGNSTNAAAAWGPWAPLGSLSAVVEEIKKPKTSIGKTGKWKVRQWASSGKSLKWNDKDIPDPAASFAGGGNPFNAHTMGLFLGHGVSSTGGSYNTPQGVKTLSPQHYMPVITNPATGTATWVRSASQVKYGAAGTDLNWMFLMTCNSLRDHAPHAIYSVMKNAGTLPIGPNLHVLCGYETSIDIAAGMGTLLSDGLLIGENAAGTNTVVLAWENVWANSLNNGLIDAKGNPKGSRTARAVFWPECENDTIYGVKFENVTEPAGPYDQSRLKERDFK